MALTDNRGFNILVSVVSLIILIVSSISVCYFFSRPEGSSRYYSITMGSLSVLSVIFHFIVFCYFFYISIFGYMGIKSINQIETSLDKSIAIVDGNEVPVTRVSKELFVDKEGNKYACGYNGCDENALADSYISEHMKNVNYPKIIENITGNRYNFI